MSSYYPDEKYINAIKQAGTAPDTAQYAVTNQTWFPLFKNFVDGLGKPELTAYANVLDSLEMKEQDPEAVWNNIKVDWSRETTEVFKEHLDNPQLPVLKYEMIMESTSNLEDVYGEFLSLVGDIKGGALDGDADDGLMNQIDNLINELAVAVKNEGNVDKLANRLNPKDFGTTSDELDNLLNGLAQFDPGSDKKIKEEFRKSVKLDESELNKLLDELMDEPVPTAMNEEIDKLLNQLALATKDALTKDLIDFLDEDDFQADENGLEGLLDELENYAKSGQKQDDLINLRGSMKISEHDINKLIDELLDDGGKLKVVPIDPEVNKKIDKLLDELVESAPNPSNRSDLLNSASKDLDTGDDFINYIDELVKLSQAEDKKVRRSLSQGLTPKFIDELINALENFDAGDDRPEAVRADDWDSNWVDQMNATHIKAAVAGKPIAVVVNGEYALIGDEWNSTDKKMAKYRSSLTPAWRGEKGYPGAAGLTETGQVVIEKGSGVFNAGKVIVNGITSRRNRDGIAASAKTESKKKVVFND